jgi:hypothetical protein
MIIIPETALNWLSLILKERFGYNFTISYRDLSIRLSVNDFESGYIFFPKLEENFYQIHSELECERWDAMKENWRGVFKSPIPAPSSSKLINPLIDKATDHYIIHYDILGLTYWMLNRIEEIGRTDLDAHGRFPAVNSHAYINDYLDRPIVDEWLFVLGLVIKKMWPNIILKKHQYTMKLSHDVDRPSRYGFKNFRGLIRTIGGDLLKEKKIISILLAPYIKFTTKKELHSKDPFNTFDWIMDKSEAKGLKSSFYFICGGIHKNDADYNLEDPAIGDLIRKIHTRGHEIGLHPSYDTFQSPSLINREFNALKKFCNDEGIYQENWGGRMHYLRWEHPATLQAWEDAGLDYDSTLGYADKPGFRCGTCFEYPSYNPLSNKILKIRIRPLIVMECTIISKRYLGLGSTQAAQERVLYFNDVCKKVNGCFSLLWHNSEIKGNEFIYSAILAGKDEK